MILTICTVMARSVLRDRGALALTFVLPPALFLIFATIFAGSTGEDAELRLAFLDSVDSARSRAVAAALEEDPKFRVIRVDGEIGQLHAALTRERADAGLWIRAEPGGRLEEDAPLVLLVDAGGGAAVLMLTGRVQEWIQDRFPEFMLERVADLVAEMTGGLDAAQQRMLDEALAEMGEDSGGAASGVFAGGLIEQQRVEGMVAGRDGVRYYAGAVAILFLLLAASHGSLSLVDERDSGVLERLMAGPAGIRPVLLGKGLYLTAQGVLQVGLIFVLAWGVYGIGAGAGLGPWLITSVLAGGLAAWAALLLAVLCRSRQQTIMLSTSLVLILAAAGGSMMPRFLMPEWLRTLGWLTPNAWAIEAWERGLVAGQPMAAMFLPWSVLLVAGLVCMLLCLWLAGRIVRN